MTDIIKGINLIIQACELWKDYENKNLTKEQLDQRIDAIMNEITIAYNESDKKDDPDTRKDFEELIEKHKKFKNWIKTAEI
jgi:hypothetical protein